MKSHRIPRPSILVMPLVAALALAGCDAADRDAGDADDADTLATARGADTAAARSGDARQGDTVDVRLEDFRIDMPIRLVAGPTTFRVTNAGEAGHNFEIEGQGVEEEFESNLAPGATETMQVDLAAGEYTVYCPVGDHRDRGMEVTVTVGSGTGSP